jgi:Mce-associated membrane protein
VSKHSEDKTAEEETTVAPIDTDTEKVEDEVTDESTEKVDEPDEPTGVAGEEASELTEPAEKPERRIQWARVFAYGVLPAVALLLAMGAGYLKWMDNSVRDSDAARIQSTQAAKDSTIALLSYKADTVEQQLGAARDLLTGEFRDSYTSLTNDVVIPGAKQKQISAVATVPAAASVSADPHHAVVLLFINQTVIVGQGAPSDSASSVRVTLDKVGDRWLISKFDPV